MRQAGNKKWRVARAPIAGIIASFLEIGWQPLTPVLFQQPSPREGEPPTDWQFPGSGGLDSFLAEIKVSIDHQLWRKVGNH